MKRVKNLRWWIAGLLALATALNYLDRQNFPVAIVEIQKTIPISESQYADLQVLFLMAYALMYAGGGKIMDLLGTRVGYALMIAWWSGANFINGLVRSVPGLGAARFLLGLGEGGGFPGSAKAVAEWFPPQERSFAFGLFNTGSSIGAVAAPPLIAMIILGSNWHWVFYLTGGAGFVWVAVWLKFYNLPGKHKLITQEEKHYILDALQTAPNEPSIPWIRLFKYRQIWGLLIAKFLTDAAWFFFIFWIPKYLGDVRHLNIKQIGYYAWIPYAFAGAGSFIGGWLSSFLMRRHLSLDRSRKICLGVSAALMPVSLLIAKSPLGMAIAFFGLALFGHQFWSTIVQTLAADLFPTSTVGSVSGLMGCVGSFGAMIFNFIVGVMLSYFHSYAVVFTIAGLLHPASFLVILLLVPKIGLPE